MPLNKKNVDFNKKDVDFFTQFASVLIMEHTTTVNLIYPNLLARQLQTGIFKSYAKGCLMSLLENMAKQVVVIKDSILDDILQFLDQFYGREVQTILENPTAVNSHVSSARFTVTYEARIIKCLLLQIIRN